jgi:two-component system cell cycle response regulator
LLQKYICSPMRQPEQRQRARQARWILRKGEAMTGAEGHPDRAGQPQTAAGSLSYLHQADDDLTRSLRELETRVYLTLNGISEQASALATYATERGRPADAIRARLMCTDARSRSGDAASAREQQLELHVAAQPWPPLASRAAMMLATSCDRLGERSQSMRWIRSALQDWPEDDHPAWRAEALMVFALQTLSHAGVDYALVRHAVSEVQTHCEPLLASVTLANFAETAAECGDLPIATEFADSAVALLRRHPEIVAPLTLDSIACARLAAGELESAEQGLKVALRLEEKLGCTDVQGDPWLTLSEVLLARGDAKGALQMLAHPRRLKWAAKSSWTLSRDLRLRSEILAALGRWQEAYSSLREHLGVYEVVRSVEGDRAVVENTNLQIVDEERRRARQFEQLALTDALTGLPNRRQVDRWFSEAADTVGEHGITIAIADLDHFKRINDTYSHGAGDEVLRQIASSLQAFCVESCASGNEVAAARLGGEEFLLLWRGCTPQDAIQDATSVLARLRQEQFPELGPQVRITASIGLASGEPRAQGSNLLSAADACLYEAKRSGRDRLVTVRSVPDDNRRRAHA